MTANYEQTYESEGEINFFLKRAMQSHTFSHLRVLPCACHCAVDLTDHLHVVQEGIEGIEVGEADHVSSAAPCSLGKKTNKKKTQYHI